MANDYYNPSNAPATSSALSSATIRAEFASIGDGMEKMVDLTSNPNKVVKVNAGGTGQTASTITDDGTNVSLSGDLTVGGGNVTVANIGPDADSQHALPNVASDTVTLNAATQTLTNKTISGGSNTLSNIANASLTNSAVTVNGSSVSLGGSTTVTANTTNALTMNNGGAGAASGTTFNGSAAQTISYNTIGAAASSHAHGNITSDGAIGSTSGLPIITTTSGVLTAGSFGTAAGTFCQGNDSRLSDARTPTAHTHGNITNAGAIGTTADLPIKTTTSGVLAAGAWGTTAGTFCQGNDSRLSDARTPTSHAVNASTYGYGDGTNAGHLRVGTGLSVTTGTVSLNLGNANSWTAVQRSDYATASVSTTSTYSFDGSDQIRHVTFTNAITVTFGAPSGLTTGAYYTFILQAGDTSARTYAWNAAWKFPGATSPLTAGPTTNGSVDIITFVALSATTAAYVGHQADCR